MFAQLSNDEPLEVDSKSKVLNYMDAHKNVTLYRYGFNFGLIIMYCVTYTTHKDKKKVERKWFNDSDNAYKFYDVLQTTVKEPTFTKGPEYRELS